MLLAARCSKTFTNFCFPLTALIRLYEFLKNSRGNQEIANQSINTDQHQNNLIQVALMLRQISNRWWRMTGSNRRPPACKAGALPAELIPRRVAVEQEHLVGLVGLEPTTPALSRRCSNQLSYRPKPVTRNLVKPDRWRLPSNNR